MCVKGLGFLTQIVTARLLLKEQFGTVALALTVSMFVNLVHQGGLRESLSKRQSEFDEWSTDAFWFSCLCGLLAIVLLLVAAPIAAQLYGKPELELFTLILGTAIPFQVVSNVAWIKMQVDMRFKAIALITLANTIVISAVSIGLALAGWGAYALLLPVPIVSAFHMLIALCMAGAVINVRTLRPWRWLVLTKEGLLLTAAFAFITVTQQGDYFALQMITRSPELVGIYFLAFTLSMQTASILTTALNSVLLPVLSRMQDNRQRQAAAFLSATRMLAVVASLPCLMQAVLAEPIVLLLFGEKWLPSVPALCVLSIGMLARVVTMGAQTLLKAQGSFRLYLTWSALYAVAFVPAVLLGARLGSIIGVAIAVSLCMWIAELLCVWLSIRGGGMGWLNVFRAITTPILLAATCAVAAFGFDRVVQSLLSDQPAVRIAVVGAFSVCLYAMGLRIVSRTDAMQIVALLRRRSGGGNAVDAAAG
jgi:PST family polysaccharide transporter